MKAFLNNIWKKTVDFCKRNPEILAIPIGLIVWKFSVYILRFLDPTSAVYDAGIFQIPIFAIIVLFVFVSTAWLFLKLIFGTARRYLSTEFKNDFQKLEKWQKIKLSYAIFFALIFILTILSTMLK